MHQNTKAFVEKLGSARVCQGHAALPNVELMEDEVEELQIEVMRLRREHRKATADETDPDVRGRFHEYESRLGAVEREAKALLEPLARLRKAVLDLTEAHPRIQEELTKSG